MKVLYISPDGILDDLGQSQILPYIYGLNNKGYKFVILSFERTYRTGEEFLKQKKVLKDRGIEWYYLPFYQAKYNRLLRVLFGAIKINIICRKHNINLVHLRSINAGIIFLVSAIRCPYLYDIRAFAGQLVDYGLLKKSWFSKLIINIEKILINKSAGIVVLDESGAKYLNNSFNLNIPLQIIPTATNIKKFKVDLERIADFTNETLKFVFLGGAQFPYLPREALKFLKILLKNKIDCNVDIINKSHHKFIYKVIEELNFPRDKIRIFSLEPSKIFNYLPNYDCGLVFIETGDWIKMSSPTKIGEYLAAGLHIVGLEGIEILDRLSKESISVDLLPRNFDFKGITLNEIKGITKNIKNENRKKNSISIAKKFYDIESALKKYLKIYKSILKK